MRKYSISGLMAALMILLSPLTVVARAQGEPQFPGLSEYNRSDYPCADFLPVLMDVSADGLIGRCKRWSDFRTGNPDEIDYLQLDALFEILERAGVETPDWSAIDESSYDTILKRVVVPLVAKTLDRLGNSLTDDEVWQRFIRDRESRQQIKERAKKDPTWLEGINVYDRTLEAAFIRSGEGVHKLYRYRMFPTCLDQPERNINSYFLHEAPNGSVHNWFGSEFLMYDGKIFEVNIGGFRGISLVVSEVGDGDYGHRIASCRILLRGQNTQNDNPK